VDQILHQVRLVYEIKYTLTAIVVCFIFFQRELGAKTWWVCSKSKNQDSDRPRDWEVKAEKKNKK
jgi:hypothetical protein